MNTTMGQWTGDEGRGGNLRASFFSYVFQFKKPGGTSRGVLHERKSWFFIIRQEANPQIRGIGECAPLSGLSVDDRPDFEEALEKVCADINNINYWLKEGLNDFPAIRFGLESALLDFCNSGKRMFYPSEFTDGKKSICTNGLIWMGDLETMKRQAEEKIVAGFRCIKMKIGAIEFEKELELLKFIRDKYSEKTIELRVDANGAFKPDEALEKLERLAPYQLHSIEQPIRAGQWKAMAELCRHSPVPIALDEELIGIKSKAHKRELLAEIKPQYIILKPMLVGGFSEATEWIKAAAEKSIGWWITSALESNIGLNAIAQWTFTLGNKMPQGLGTGQLYTNNFVSPLYMEGESLYYNPEAQWSIPEAFANDI